MNFVKRLLTGIFIVAITVFALAKGGMFIFIMGLFLSTFAIYELEQALEKMHSKGNFVIALIYNFIFNLLMYKAKFDFAVITLSIFVLFEMFLFTFKDISIKSSLVDSFSILYITVSFSLMYLLKDNIIIWLVFICAWGTDTFAYIFGMLFGKTKLTSISSKKTAEGSIGGILGSILLAILFSKITGHESLLALIIVTGFGSVVSQVGDICASKIKREAGIKDYSNVLMGHGGILDRYDSVLFVIPYFALVTLIFKL
ncbi:MAG: phosphatidate cytidylyltransferase [Finegoldia sp.]|nr:phosphatidate cytidylyltransferase [Finegoldia sp.]